MLQLINKTSNVKWEEIDTGIFVIILLLLITYYLHYNYSLDVMICYLYKNLFTNMYDNITVYVQIFKAYKLWGCHKPSIFVILFLRITKYPALRLMQAKIFCHKDGNFADSQLTAKTSKIASLENLYIYDIIKTSMYTV